MQTAFDLRAAGRLEEADTLCRRIVQEDPDNAAAIHLWGVIAHQLGDQSSAIERIARAIALQPDNSAFFNNRGLALAASGRHAEAEADYRRAVAIRPDFARAHNNLGLTLSALGRGREAESCHRRAIELKPDYAQAHHCLATLAAEAGEPERAEAHFRDALAWKPDDAAANNDFGLLLQRLERPDEAERCYRRALSLDPGLAQVHCNLGGLLRDAGRLADAEAALRRAIDIAPSLAKACSNLGLVLRDQRRLNEAEECCRRAVALDPADAEAFNNLGTLQQEMLQLDEAANSYRRALALKPEFHLAAVNLSMLLLLSGDYEHGLPLYERRLDCVEMRSKAGYRATLPQLRGIRRWDGARVKGGALLVWTEQGLGDSVMMLRYLQLAKSRGFSRISVYCEAVLARLVRSARGVDEVIVKTEALAPGRFDFQCPMMSLPLALGTRLGSIPSEVPYLDLPGSAVAKWTAKVGGIRAPRVGVCWAGGRGNSEDRVRSIAPERFAMLAAGARIEPVNLRKGGPREDLAAWRDGICDWMDDCDDLVETAALISRLDLVISVDTVIAHLAGALDRPVWLLERHASDWRWLLDRRDSPWYPTMRIFRQPCADDWSTVLADVRDALVQAAGGRNPTASIDREKPRQ